MQNDIRDNAVREVVCRAGGDVFPVDRDRPRDATLQEDLAKAQSLEGFIRLAWNVVEPATDFVHGEHIRAIVREDSRMKSEE